MDFVGRKFENSSSVFKKEYINTFVGDARIRAALNGISLLNYDEFFSWYNGIAENNDDDLSDDDLVYSEDTDTLDGVKDRKKFLDMAKVICTDIGYEYGVATLDALAKRPGDMDILVAVSPDYENTNLDRSATYNRYTALRTKILGFIVVEKGECKMLSEIYCIRLICVKTTTVSGYKIKGSILLGAFLYCLKSNPSEKQAALLELANGYRNLPGFFAYSKFGFFKEVMLFHRNCFYEYGNLPMMITLDTYETVEQIIDVTLGTNTLHMSVLKKNDPTNLVFTGIPKNGKQFSLQYNIATVADSFLREEIDSLDAIEKFKDLAKRKTTDESNQYYQGKIAEEEAAWKNAHVWYSRRFDNLFQQYQSHANDTDVNTNSYLDDSYNTLPIADAIDKIDNVIYDNKFADNSLIKYMSGGRAKQRNNKKQKTRKNTIYRKKRISKTRSAKI